MIYIDIECDYCESHGSCEQIEDITKTTEKDLAFVLGLFVGRLTDKFWSIDIFKNDIKCKDCIDKSITAKDGKNHDRQNEVRV